MFPSSLEQSTHQQSDMDVWDLIVVENLETSLQIIICASTRSSFIATHLMVTNCRVTECITTKFIQFHILSQSVIFAATTVVVAAAAALFVHRHNAVAAISFPRARNDQHQQNNNYTRQTVLADDVDACVLCSLTKQFSYYKYYCLDASLNKHSYVVVLLEACNDFSSTTARQVVFLLIFWVCSALA